MNRLDYSSLKNNVTNVESRKKSTNYKSTKGEWLIIPFSFWQSVSDVTPFQNQLQHICREGQDGGRYFITVWSSHAHHPEILWLIWRYDRYLHECVRACFHMCVFMRGWGGWKNPFFDFISLCPFVPCPCQTTWLTVICIPELNSLRKDMHTYE